MLCGEFLQWSLLNKDLLPVGIVSIVKQSPDREEALELRFVILWLLYDQIVKGHCETRIVVGASDQANVPALERVIIDCC